MKTLGKILTVFALCLAASACGKKSDDAPSAETVRQANVPGIDTCMTNYNGYNSAPYYNYGIRRYVPYYTGYSSGRYTPQYHGNVGPYATAPNAAPVYYPQSQGFCGCQPNHMPACGQNVGMACVPTSRYRNYQPATWAYNYRYNQITAGAWGVPSYNMNAGQACYSNFAQLCIVGQLDSCSMTGGICRPTTRHAQVGSFGVCVRN